MADTYQVTGQVRAVNRLTTWMARRGFGPSVELTTTGIRTGQQHTIPVSPIVIEGVEYLVSPYGERNWVRNVRANPAVTMRRGKTTRTVTLEELPLEEAAQVLVSYHAKEKYARRYMAVPDQPTVSDFLASTDPFPVFRVV